ncbi:MAG: ice-binding family protein, partial [Planctomycetota bacterium]|nr:ice-binding family protein [Planctomycetota bacterium]
MNRKCLILAAIAATVLLCHAAPGFADLTPLLGSAENFAVLGGSTVTNTGATKITGDLGVSPGSAVTGFPPGLVSGGTIHAGDAAAAAAQGAFTLAYNGLANMSVPTGNNLTALGDLGGLTLNPGVYKFDSSAGLTGTLTLDAQGNNDVYWVFQIGS